MNIFMLMYFTESLKGKGRYKKPELKCQKINNLIATRHPKLHARVTLKCQCSNVMSSLSVAIDLRNISTCCNLDTGLPLS
jgi:hypothetical protein